MNSNINKEEALFLPWYPMEETTSKVLFTCIQLDYRA